MPRLRVSSLAILSLSLMIPVSNASADAADAFSSMRGTWTGSGQMRLDGGRTENLRCRANYTDRNRGRGLGISLRCASASSKVDLHASLAASGSRITGNWEEREFNTGGTASGTARGNDISLSIGGGLDGSISVSTSGSRQSVSITTENVALKGIRIALSRE